MKTFIVQKEVETGKTTEQYDSVYFDNLKDAEIYFNTELSNQENLAGEYNIGEFSEYYKESLVITVVDGEDIEDLKSISVYEEGMKDKNNYRGNYANWYYYTAKFNGAELVYNFYDNRKDLNIEYSNIKKSELNKWFNY
ncbi:MULTISPECIES: hypothetical protein [Flavobacterium]|uniref:Uncharacterized protein n=1 Tax=Flavobacterium keumense TaxID=1306518 RepID=A0ABY8N2C9_9FLAO|nr:MULTISPECIES: hypothetical protein [Flavobacterium]WGK93819.1 hypothetical protein MG292_06870 [Flavobacterium keumense]